MRSLLYAVLAIGVPIFSSLSIGANAMQNDTRGTNGDSVKFYKVPRPCHAALGMGCGSLSKPILLDLESKPIVKEAWLDRQGKPLAIVWKEGSLAAERTILMTAI